MPTALDELAQRIAALEAAIPELSRSSRLAYSSVDDGALTVTADGTVRAIIGQQPDGTTAVNIVNGPPPPAPSDPAVSPVLGGVLATWNGHFADGAPAPLDFARVEVHASLTAGFTPGTATLVTTVESPQGGAVVVPTAVPVWVLLMARSTSGTASAPSGAAHSGPAKVVADSVLAGIVDELALADDAVTAAKVAVGAINADAIADAAVTAVKLGAAAVEAAALAPGAVTGPAIAASTITSREIAAGTITTAELAAGSVSTANLAAGAVTAAVLAAGAVTASKLTSNSVSAGKITADAVTAGKIAADAVTGREIKALSITADKLAVNSITADQLAAGAVTAAVLAADAIDGRTIKGITITGGTITGGTITGGTITGGTVQTGQSGRRVLLSPVDPTDNSATPSALLYSGAAAERAPARLTGEVQSTPDGSTPTARLTGPQVTTDGAHTPRLLLRSGGPATGYSARGGFLLDVYGAANSGGQAMVAGYAGSTTDPASVELSVRRFGSSVKTAITRLDPESWSVQLADQVANLYLSSSGLTIKAVLGEVLLQTGTGLRLQGGNVNVAGGLVVGDGTWKGLSFKQGCTQLGGWRAVTVKKLPDGMVALRGIVSVPAGVTSGVIATIDDPALRPKEPEVFPAATPNNVNGNVFVQTNGSVEVWNTSGNLGGWLSFGGIQWSCVD